MKVTIFGSGYVGLVTGACLAEMGNHVVCVDVDPRKIDLLNAGGVPIHEPGLDELIASNRAKGRLEFTTDALDLIAERALQRRTGARALRAVMDEIMLDLMYHLPEMDNVNTVYVLDAAAIRDRKPLTAMRRRARESA